ncbi:syntaxin-12-like isoform X1 [Saccostrea cucullata]|uniref:syntaxin-12-like isoform X1 n=1 Tax=Saccostrea cuccullata TaxID=36930 RepID=UPI002ED332AD
MEEDVDLEMLREREDAIKQLESDITDVNQIFKDLGMLVHEQGEMLDSIEANVETTATHVEEGRKQLSQAQTYQSKARRKKCICVVILVVVLAVIVIIIAATLGAKNN